MNTFIECILHLKVQSGRKGSIGQSLAGSAILGGREGQEEGKAGRLHAMGNSEYCLPSASSSGEFIRQARSSLFLGENGRKRVVAPLWTWPEKMPLLNFFYSHMRINLYLGIDEPFNGKY